MLIPCEECKKSISSEAKQCPGCGHPVKEDWVKAQMSSASGQDKPDEPHSLEWDKARESMPTKSEMGCGCLLAIFLAAAILYAGFAVFSDDDNGESASTLDSAPRELDVCDSNLAEAYTLAQFSVKRTLSVPNSVDFPFFGVGDVAIVANNETLCTYKVLSTLEAQNLHGATLERRWTARVKYMKADGDFVVDFAKVLE